MKKRVWNLYRVSTDRQVEKDDVPMQKNACRAFIDSKPDWELTREFSELGVSGFKKSASQRDKLEQIKQGAINKEFDVLLVWMYDRLGRKHEETPFIVEWFVKQGIEVWSVMEGQRTFESHVDSLTNYITFWQASGESIKTSVRVKEKISQLNEEGMWTGSAPPYGYEVYDTGIKHPKKDKNIKDLRVSPSEAKTVQVIFDLALSKGYGAPMIARWLNEPENLVQHPTRRGTVWRDATISRILRNPIVCGFRRYGYYKDETHVDMSKVKLQPFNEELVIVSQEDFQKVQDIITTRRLEMTGVSKVDSSTPRKSKLLLSGIAKCGYCGKKLYVKHDKGYNTLANGETSTYHKSKYFCKEGKQLKDSAHVAIHFGYKKYEGQVEAIVKDFISRIDKDLFMDEINKYQKDIVVTKKQTIDKLKKELEENYQDLKGIRSLRVKVELGQSNMSAEVVEEMMLEQEKLIASKNEQLKKLEAEIGEVGLELSNYHRVMFEMDGWADKYDSADVDTKRMMLSRIIKELHFKKDEIDISLIIPLEKAIVGGYSHNDADSEHGRLLGTYL
ncbi:recombinase family protein [Paenibacillus sp. MMO-177]|uniref:recombinase family protein n=1 Tax=Paenibacillus sp. MMO-177 TaxID=3081289 RepID=UPI003017D6E4